VDGERVYAVADVIKIKNSVINEDCSDENQHYEGDAETSRNYLPNQSTVSRMMIEQFFAEIEEPDLEWQYEDYER
jgi:hypothetical protein